MLNSLFVGLSPDGLNTEGVSTHALNPVGIRIKLIKAKLSLVNL